MKNVKQLIKNDSELIELLKQYNISESIVNSINVRLEKSINETVSEETFKMTSAFYNELMDINKQHNINIAENEAYDIMLAKHNL
tara:strand:+ start:4488 stop:4742 length:255 start_codon:yes stop_codon:yes gene_type:complete